MTTFSTKAGATLRITFALPEPVPTDSVITARMARGSDAVDFAVRPLTPEGISPPVIAEIELSVLPPVSALADTGRWSADVRVASADGMEVYYINTFFVIVGEPVTGRNPPG